MLHTRLLISKSSDPIINYLVTVPSAPFSVGITVTFMFLSFFSSLARSRCLSLFSLSKKISQWTAGTAKSSIRQLLFLGRLSPGLVVCPRLHDPFVSQNTREFCASYSPGQTPGCPYTVCSYGQITFFRTIPSGSPVIIILLLYSFPHQC